MHLPFRMGSAIDMRFTFNNLYLNFFRFFVSYRNFIGGYDATEIFCVNLRTYYIIEGGGNMNPWKTMHRNLCCYRTVNN